MIGSNTLEVFFVACDDCDEASTSPISAEDAEVEFTAEGGFIDGDIHLCEMHTPRCPECGDYVDGFSSGVRQEDGSLDFTQDGSVAFAIDHAGYCPEHATDE